MRFILASVLAASLLTPILSCAEVQLGEYRKIQQAGGHAKETLDTYIAGVGRGFVMASYFSKGMFCFPEGFILQGQNFQNFIDVDTRDGTIADSMAIEIILFSGILRRFPCPTGARK